MYRRYKRRWNQGVDAVMDPEWDCESIVAGMRRRFAEDELEEEAGL